LFGVFACMRDQHRGRGYGGRFARVLVLRSLGSSKTTPHSPKTHSSRQADEATTQPQTLKNGCARLVRQADELKTKPQLLERGLLLLTAPFHCDDPIQRIQKPTLSGRHMKNTDDTRLSVFRTCFLGGRGAAGVGGAAAAHTGAQCTLPQSQARP
jgi:hypothetical protein